VSKVEASKRKIEIDKLKRPNKLNIDDEGNDVKNK
jgi:hypothetical protein